MNNYVDLLIKRLKIEYQKQDRSGVYGYTQRTLAYNSNKIEGSTLSQKQTSSLFDTKTLTTDSEYVRVKDIEEATGHFIMFNNMLNTYDENLSEEVIKNYHYDLKSGVFEDKANGYPIGEYKSRKNIVSNITTTLPEDVSKEMQHLLGEYNSNKNKTFDDIAKFHVLYEKIHPFQDGNGRTGRIIIYKECLKNKIYPFIIRDENKQKYYDCLAEAQINNNYSPLVNFFKEEQKYYFSITKDLICDYNSDNDTNKNSD